jgi:ribonuclease P protein component
MKGTTGLKHIKKVMFTKKGTRAQGLYVGVYFDNQKLGSKLELIDDVLLIVPKKLYKKAHTRNKLKRRLRAILITFNKQNSQAFDHLQIKDYTMSVVIKLTSKEVISFTYLQLKQTIDTALNKLISSK